MPMTRFEICFQLFFSQVPVASWFDDMNDRELLDLIPFLDGLSRADSVYGGLKAKFKHGGNNGSMGDGRGHQP